MPRTAKKTQNIIVEDDSDLILDRDFCLQDQQNEYYELLETLSKRFDASKKSVTETHGNTVRYDGLKVIDHVNAVVGAAGHLANEFWVDCYEYERQYNQKVCQTVALFHEYLLTRPLRYEELLGMTDYATTNALMAILPDFRKPFTERLMHLNNAVGHATEHAKLVRIADLLYDGMRINQFLKARENNVELPLGFQGYTADWVQEAKSLLLTLMDFFKDHRMCVWRDKLKELTVPAAAYAKVK